MKKILALTLFLVISVICFGQISISDFGASPSKTGVENRNAINAAVNSCNNCSIIIPEGTYNVAKPTGGLGYYGLSAIVLDGKSNVTIKGGKQSIIKLESGSYPADTHIFYVRNSNNITLEGFTINGNRYGHTTSNEQMHGVEIFDSNSVTLDNLDIVETRGDGVFIIGNTLSNNVKINRSNFIRNGRSGITLQRLIRNVFINGNYFENCNDQSIDSEPTGGAGYTSVSVDNNIFTKDSYQNILVSIGGSGSRVVSFTNNKVFNGGLFVTSVIDCDITGNYIEGSISVLEACKNVNINTNHLKKDGGRIIYVYYQNGQPENFKIINNFLEGSNVTNAIDVQSNGLKIEDNDIKLISGSVGIKVAFPVVTTDDLDDVKVIGNTIRNVATGISFDGSTTKKYRSATITGNVIQDFRSPKLITKGININGSSSYFFNDLVIHTNTYDASLTAPVSLNSSAVNYYKSIDGSLLTSVEPNSIQATNGTIAKHLTLPYRYKSSGNGWTEIDYDVKNQIVNTKTGINFTGNAFTSPFGGWLTSPEMVATSLSSSRAMYVINSTANGKVQALLRSNQSPEFGGLVFRMKDDLNYWVFRVSATKIQVVKRIGTESVVFETSNIFRDYVIVSVEMRDNILDFYINGKKITSINDSFNKEYGTNGVYSNVVNRYYFSDFVIGM